MPTTATKADVVQQAGEKLRLAAIGRDLREKDSAKLTREYEILHAELVRDGKVAWPIEEAPLWAQAHLAHMLAARCAGEYHSGEMHTEYLQKGAVASRQLGNLTADNELGDTSDNKGFY